MALQNHSNISSISRNGMSTKSGWIRSLIGARVTYLLLIMIFIMIFFLYLRVRKPVLISPFYELEKEMKFNFSTSPHKLEAKNTKDYYFDTISRTQFIPRGILFVALSVPPADFQRRTLMRTHQIRRFAKYGIEFKFFMGGYAPALHEAIQFENQTSGDLIVMNGPRDSVLCAEGRKAFEIFKYIEHNMDPYKYIAKLDSDTYLNIAGLWDYVFNKEVQDLEFAIIASFRRGFAPFDFSQGGFEAISWKTMLMLNKFSEYVPLSTSVNEDAQISWYFYDAGIKLTHVELDAKQAYDFRPGVVLSTWNNSTDVYYETIKLHALTKPYDYVNVASCFFSDGVNISQVMHMREINWTKKS